MAFLVLIESLMPKTKKIKFSSFFIITFLIARILFWNFVWCFAVLLKSLMQKIKKLFPWNSVLYKLFLHKRLETRGMHRSQQAWRVEVQRGVEPTGWNWELIAFVGVYSRSLLVPMSDNQGNWTKSLCVCLFTGCALHSMRGSSSRFFDGPGIWYPFFKKFWSVAWSRNVLKKFTSMNLIKWQHMVFQNTNLFNFNLGFNLMEEI